MVETSCLPARGAPLLEDRWAGTVTVDLLVSAEKNSLSDVIPAYLNVKKNNTNFDAPLHRMQTQGLGRPAAKLQRMGRIAKKSTQGFTQQADPFIVWYCLEGFRPNVLRHNTQLVVHVHC